VASKRSNEMTIEHIYGVQMINTSQGDVFMIERSDDHNKTGISWVRVTYRLGGLEARYAYAGQRSDINTCDLTIERNDGHSKTGNVVWVRDTYRLGGLAEMMT
jgi:hypothetical protein